MKSVALAVALVALVVFCGSSTANAAKESLLSGANRCCSSRCDQAEKDMLTSQMDLYVSQGGEDAEGIREYLNFCVSGRTPETPPHMGKRGLADSYLRCPFGPYNAANGDVDVVCQLSVTTDTGLFYMTAYSYMYFYIGNTYQYRSLSTVSGGYYYDQTANKTTYTDKVTFRIPRYAAPGNYTVRADVYAYNFALAFTVDSVFNVSTTTNDLTPPTLVSIDNAIININEEQQFVSFTAKDDLSGVTTVVIYFMSGGTTVGYAYYYPPYVNGQYVGQLAVSAAATVYFYNGVVAGTYSLRVNLADVVGGSKTYETSDLIAMGIQSNVTFGQSDCAAGKYKPYGSTATTCTSCGAGTFSAAGAFRCKACLPGTTSKATGATSCNPCPAGTSGIGGSWACSACAAGTYSYYSGTAVCTPCQPGYNSSSTGATSCGYCMPGTYSTGGKTTCTACPVGTYSSYGTYMCQDCPPGTYASTTGCSSCMPCPANKYSTQGATSCTSCPASKPKGPPGSNSSLNCYA